MTMTFRPFEDFTPIAPTSAATMQKYSGLLEEAVLEMWQIHGFGLAANEFLKVIDPDYHREMVGEYLPHRDMVPLFATGLGDIVVASGGGYQVLQYYSGGLDPLPPEHGGTLPESDGSVVPVVW